MRSGSRTVQRRALAQTALSVATASCLAHDHKMLKSEEAVEGKSRRSCLIGSPLRHGVMFATPLMPCRSWFDRNLSKPEIVETVLAEIFHAFCVLMVQPWPRMVRFPSRSWSMTGTQPDFNAPKFSVSGLPFCLLHNRSPYALL